jgi:hypothetical protein
VWLAVVAVLLALGALFSSSVNWGEEFSRIDHEITKNVVVARHKPPRQYGGKT